jgi:deoxyribodipyrimidine photo-lyase
MSDLILFWHRRDLRLSDNWGLSKAIAKSKKTVGVFCFDPSLLNREDVAPARVYYLIGCLEELTTRYQRIGSQLLIFSGNPQEKIPLLAQTLKAQAVHWNLDVEPYAQSRDEAVARTLREQGIVVDTVWDQLLHAPNEVLSQSGTPYKVYTPFWKTWSKIPAKSPYLAPQSLVGLSSSEQSLALQVGAIALPTALDLGFRWENPLPLAPGEQAAQEQLKAFCQSAILDYGEQRNFPAQAGTSLLSAALKFGAIGIRDVWQQAQEILTYCNSDEARNHVQTWQQELAWREFYQHCLFFFPELAKDSYRTEFRKFPWENNLEHFQAWCDGRTGYPIVDAAMRQLKATGWMHNRCRMIVASFLTKDLILNWQWGEKYFMQTLVDGDLSANNGGWQWSASSGMDPKPLRIFNPASQALRFDPDGDYIRHWLPELATLDTAELLSGKISRGDRECLNYPAPIVDHAAQQREFKQRYQQIKKN